MTDREAETHEILGIVDRIRPLLAGRDPVVQSAVLADLVSQYLAGWKGPDIKQTRRKLFEIFENLVWRLVSVTEAHEAGEHDEDEGSSHHADA